MLFLIMGNFTPQSRVDRVPQSKSTFVTCDPRETANGILTSTKVPRDAIFHYGKKELLLEDVNEGNIPKSIWDEFIMGEKTRFKLKRFRRGFYGSEFAEDADRFGDSTYNWLIKIILNQECLNSSRVVSLVYLTKSPLFKTWYESKQFPNSFEQWKSTCFDQDSYPREKKFNYYKNQSESADFTESECEKVIENYYEEQNFAFTHDASGDLVRSWAIRDRECISKIEGSEDFWSKEFATKGEYWVNTCNRERNHRNNIRVWFSALQSYNFTPQLFVSFYNMIKKIVPPEDSLEWQTQSVDRFAAQDFAEALVIASRKCTGIQQSILRAALEEISKKVDQLQSSEVKTKLETLCR